VSGGVTGFSSATPVAGGSIAVTGSTVVGVDTRVVVVAAATGSVVEGGAEDGTALLALEVAETGATFAVVVEVELVVDDGAGPLLPVVDVGEDSVELDFGTVEPLGGPVEVGVDEVGPEVPETVDDVRATSDELVVAALVAEV
jgi:hypothetical protein